MNKADLARKIQALEGLSNEEKTSLLELVRGHKKYGLVWEDKPEDIEERLRKDLPVLVERNDDKVHPIISDNPDAPNHLIIEGDNLAALTELSYTHAGKVDVIYIDPPYNTGNKDFIYNDTFVDSEDSYRHSKWLSFIAKRLLIAKKLLSARGVIFISIDDNEQANLKLLCDEIFGENNLISNLIWKRKRGRDNSARWFSKAHEYCLIYALHRDNVNLNLLPLDEETKKAYRNPDNDSRGPYRMLGCWARGTQGGVRYDFTSKDGIFFSERLWLFSKENLRKLDQENKLIFRGDNIYRKMFLFENKGKVPESLWDDTSNAANASDEIKGIFSSKIVFDTPKPVPYIKRMLYLSTNSRAIVLDFFAGSGTTLHAVMQLNAEDGGNRTCILCTNNENGICENVTYERNKRVIEGYTKPNGEEVAGLTDNNLRYYRTEFLPRERSVKNMRELVHASTGLLCIKNDLYTEAPFGGRKMNPKYARYFENNGKRMLVIYEEQAIPFIADIIKTMPEGEKIKVYVFSHGSYAYEDEFAEVLDRVRLCALPQAIYDAYQKVLPKRKPKFLVDELVEEIVEVDQHETEGLFSFDNEKG